MVNRRVRSAAIAAVAVASLAAAAAPSGATAAPGRAAVTRPATARPAAHIRAYDTSMLAHSNAARTSDHRRDYAMNHKLWKVAHAWAEHLAATGDLEHNPKLEPKLLKACPNWTAIGENVGVVYGGGVHKLFSAYMHSPPHRANILDKRYTQVGIATVKIVVNGQAQQWDVMDFGNHC